MRFFGWLFGRRTATSARKARRYEFVTGNVEFAIRFNNGEPFHALIEEIKPKWTPGNEFLWDEYDVDSLIDSQEKKAQVVNQLLYSRIVIYRALRDNGREIKGNDPFNHLEEAEEQVRQLKTLLPFLFPGGTLSVPVYPIEEVMRESRNIVDLEEGEMRTTWVSVPNKGGQVDGPP